MKPDGTKGIFGLDDETSGIFDFAPEPDPIGDLEGVGDALSDITNTQGNPAEDGGQQVNVAVLQSVAGIVLEYSRRLRLLTYAVVAIAIYLVLKEAK